MEAKFTAVDVTLIAIIAMIVMLAVVWAADWFHKRKAQRAQEEMDRQLRDQMRERIRSKDSSHMSDDFRIYSNLLAGTSLSLKMENASVELKTQFGTFTWVRRGTETLDIKIDDNLMEKFLECAKKGEEE